MTSRELFFVLLKKDFRVELRARDALFTAFFFSIVAIVVFTFAIFEPQTAARLVNGLVWVATTFAATFLFSRSFAREVEAGTLDLLLMSAAPRPLVFLSKWVVNFTFSICVALFVAGLASFLFTVPLTTRFDLWLAVLALGLFGFTALGTLLSAMVASARLRDGMLPIALYPLSVPALLAAVKGSQALTLPGTPDFDAWIMVLLIYDGVFGAAALWLFGMVVEE
ncbi:MAG: heme exporter protein CcmB [Deltaproteobacteria bacterium]|nr:heme exporter protein CcmB [Deltaproteobacteria bacterium]